MEIPDINYNKPTPSTIYQQQTQFYTIKSYIQQQSDTNQNLYNYEQSFKSIIQDEIQKKTMNVAWQTRHFCLTSTRLIYYLDKNKQQVKGCFNLASLRMFQVRTTQNQLIIKLVVCIDKINKTYKELLLLNFQNNPLRFPIWRKQIQSTLQKCQKISKQLIPHLQLEQITNTHLKIHGDNYWNRITISSLQMKRYVNQLDIIFFKSKTPIASVHRLIMRSKFDHVGLLLRDSHNNIIILQAIQSRGVWINQWSQMLSTFSQHYQQIAIRKLLLGNNKLDFQHLQNYLDAVIGNKYQLSLSKLFISQNSSISQQQQIQNTQQNKQNQNINGLNINSNHTPSNKNMKDKTYFCSQLIADIYIKCGFIKGKKKNQFWPKDFQSSQLFLQHGIKLSPLMYLKF